MGFDIYIKIEGNVGNGDTGKSQKIINRRQL